MHSLNPVLVTGNKDPKPSHDPAHQTIYQGRPPKSHFYDLLFLDLLHTSMVFCLYLFKDITLCKSFVICLVCPEIAFVRVLGEPALF
jgi:hypothetical protein